MALLQLYDQTTPSLNPSGLTNILPGGAGSITTGSTPVPGISSPALESWQREVFDYTAPTLIASNGTTPGTPAPVGKLLVNVPQLGAFGAVWKLNNSVKQPVGQGQFGIVYTPGLASEMNGTTSSAMGNIAQNGTKAVVITEGPAKAFVQGTVGATAISAGMPLAADGAGNLTFAGTSPGSGSALATYADATIASSVSIPVLRNIYVGGY